MVGWAAILLGVFSILPFLAMGLVAIPKLEPSRWSVVDLHILDWGSIFKHTPLEFELLGFNHYFGWRGGKSQ